MRYAFLLFLGFFCCALVTAQPVIDLPDSEIKWQEMEYDFGLREEGEATEHVFWFENTGTKPLKIYNVLPTCGCTTPDWTKEEVPPGGKGFVKLVFDSHGRMGIQNKMVTVVANTEPRNSVLKFTVDVYAGPPPGPEDNVNVTAEVPPPGTGRQLIEATQEPLTYIRFAETEYRFGAIKEGDSLVHEFHFTNSGESDLLITDVKASCGCTTPAWPKEPVKPGQEGVIQVKFNSAGKQGQQDKTVTVRSNGEPSAVVLHVKGQVDMGPTARVQFDEVMWKYEKKGAPKKLRKVFTFSNQGDAPLIIKSVQTNCDCLKAEFPSQPVAPGGKGEVMATLNTKGCPCEGTMTLIFDTNGFPQEAGITIMPQ